MNRPRSGRSASIVRAISRRRTSAHGPRHPSLTRGVGSDLGSSSFFNGRSPKGLPCSSSSESASSLPQLQKDSEETPDDERNAPRTEADEAIEKSDVSSLPDSRGPAADGISHVEDLEAETSSEDENGTRSSVASSGALQDSNAGLSLDEGFDLKKLLSENRKALKIRGIHRRGIFPTAGSGVLSKRSRSSQRRDVRCTENCRRGQPDFSRLSGASCPNREGYAIDVEDDESEGDMTTSERWFEYLRDVPREFCDPRNEEACMRGRRERLTPGEVCYRGLQVNQDNNEDLLFIFKHKYEAKAVRGQSLASYEQLRACSGQFARFAVVCGLIPLKKVCDPGRLFQAILSMEAIQAFLTYFQLRCSASTVLAKSFHLRTVSRYAERFFGTVQKNDEQKNMAALTTDYLTGACSAEKQESRRGTARMRSEEMRIETGKLLVGADFRRFGNAARNSLCAIVDTGAQEVRRNPKLRAKWCINFVGLLVFHGCGQRPQVYAQLQEPVNLEESIRRWERDQRVTLAALLEKRPRQTGYSKVSYPGRLLRIFEFHMRHVKPAIREAIGALQTETERRAEWSQERGEDVDNPLLLDTRTGEGYITPQIRSTLHRFLSDVDPELCDITPSVLRSSYATWKYNSYKKGRIFADLNENEFMDTLANIMNTSVEQLRATYIACREMESNYDRAMTEVHRAFDGEENNNENDDENTAE
jgi:hypothetical protein